MRYQIAKFLVAAFLSGFACLGYAQQVEPGSPPAAESSSFLFERVGSRVGDAVIASSRNVASIVNTGLGFLGVRYRLGGDGPSVGGFDCSGLIKKVFGDALGVSLPRTAAQMAQLGEKVGWYGLKRGDLVFFNTMKRTFSHAGIYLGDGKFLHAPSTGGVVRVENMDIDYWRTRFDGGRRLLMSEALVEAPSVQQ